MSKLFHGLLIAVLVGTFALLSTSCSEVDNQDAPGIKNLQFDIKVLYESGLDTKVVQTKWEDGNKVYAFFWLDDPEGMLDPASYVTLTFDATANKWNGALSGNLTDADVLGESGEMFAIFFPFGDVAVIPDGNGGVNFRTSNTAHPGLSGMPVYSYYMTARAYYTVETVGDVATLDATLKMKLPDNFVYFFVDKDGDNYYENDKYRLAVEGVYPVACTSFKNGFHETPQNGKYIGQPMWGYQYGNEFGKGIAFSGKIDNTWGASTPHRFIFFSDGDPAVAKTFSESLPSHYSVKLKAPVAGNGWEPALTAPTTTLVKGKKWANWNLGADDVNGLGFYLRWGGLVEPKDHNADALLMERHITGDLTGDRVYFDAARAYLGSSWRMPTSSEMASLGSVTSSSWIPVGNTEISVGPTVESGIYYYPSPSLKNGGWRVVDGSNSIFLPVTGMYQNTKSLKESWDTYSVGCYYTSTGVGKYLRFYNGSTTFTTTTSSSYIEWGMPVRPIKID